ncbi:hypothetical protein ACIPIN_08135 [Pseudomonas sp. NPDC087697]|uniref:hypothetical protein n=1 Tax=Pseudomonas sp. NPDC087697 TaxID=3364447 RepID=UPI0038281B24
MIGIPFLLIGSVAVPTVSEMLEIFPVRQSGNISSALPVRVRFEAAQANRIVGITDAGDQ